MSIRQVPELLGQTEAVLHMFRRYKIFCHFNAAVQIMDLKTHIKWLIYQDNEPYKTNKTPKRKQTKPQTPKETTTKITKNQTPKKPQYPLIYLDCHIYSSETETDRIVSNSKTRTKYLRSNRFPILPQTLAFPKASSLNLWIWFPWLKFHYTEMFFLHSPQLFPTL